MEKQFDLPYPRIEADSCKSCERCVAACPKGCLEISETYNRFGVKVLCSSQKSFFLNFSRSENIEPFFI